MADKIDDVSFGLCIIVENQRNIDNFLKNWRNIDDFLGKIDHASIASLFPQSMAKIQSKVIQWPKFR